MSKPVVSTDWLAKHLGEPDLIVLDASWYLPSSGRDALSEYLTAHIPGAVFWDLDAMSDTEAVLPHMMPDPTSLADRLGAIGVSDRDRVVVYDGSGVNLSAPRAWWQLRAIGHQPVWILDGGLGRWRGESRPLESGTVVRDTTSYVPHPAPDHFVVLEDVQALMEEGVQVLDARSRERFRAEAPEPRAGIRGGHIPGSLNLPFTELVTSDGTLRPPEELITRFETAGVDLTRPIITLCGSGVTACALLVALRMVGHERHLVYDGSWTEWGGRTDTPVAGGS